ncbi:EGF-like domain-containing protein [Caerostris darwini]|uniref:EGF-like domain-containing protein n=1 Tax=Caerostris darwini TaxID=1538125 RepID=A0AAV4V110_9ARAC|nr:EGF-like domain-containing protein [Caerostris darwini]
MKRCECVDGYTDAGGICKECDCGEKGTCSIVNGLKRCTCQEGYTDADGICKECECGENGTCTFSNGLKRCTCDNGYADAGGVCKTVIAENTLILATWIQWTTKLCLCHFGHVQINGYCYEDYTTSTVTTKQETSSEKTFSPTASATSTFPASTPGSCDCGKYSRSCSFDRFGRKNCDCYFGAIQINDYCHAIGSVSVISTTKMPSTTEFTTPRRETTTVASTSETTSTTKFLTTPRSCECGKYSRSCRFDYFGRQVCECYPGYVQINNYCYEESTTAVSTTEVRSTAEFSTTPKICYCGMNSRSCRLDWFGRKMCDCYSGYEQVDGFCLARTTTERPVTTEREICNDDKCLYGKCQALEHGYECRCYEGYTGSRCEKNDSTRIR